MSIKFITEIENEQELTFGMVEDDQFFVDNSGKLCQKCNDVVFHCLADNNGKPYCNRYTANTPTTPIKRILPKVTKIEF